MTKDEARLLKLQAIYWPYTEEQIGWIAYNKAQEFIKNYKQCYNLK